MPRVVAVRLHLPGDASAETVRRSRRQAALSRRSLPVRARSAPDGRVLPWSGAPGTGWRSTSGGRARDRAASGGAGASAAATATSTTPCSTTPPRTWSTSRSPSCWTGWPPATPPSSRPARDRRDPARRRRRRSAGALPRAGRRLPGPHARPRSPRSGSSPSSACRRCRPRVRVVGEVDFGETERDWLEWQRYESVINEALAGWPLWGLCVFDTQRLPEPLLESALQHALRRGPPGGRAPNPMFTAPADYLRSLPGARRAARGDSAAPAGPRRRRLHRAAPRRGRRARHRRRAPRPDRGLPARRRRDDVQRRPPRQAAGQPAALDRPATGSSAPSATAAPASTTPSPATARRTATTSPAAGWACGWPASSATTWTSPATTTAPRSGSPSAWADPPAQPNRSPRKDSFFRFL